jgi:REP element-mobilizing transposase RayT
MARKPRVEVAGGIHHVFARGNNRRRVFLDDTDRLRYLRLLGDVIARMGWHCLAYCLMDNHAHLLLETDEPNLGRGMQRLHGSYAQAFNRRHATVGHLFQGRFGSVHVEREAHLWSLSAYLALNPVAAGLVTSPDDWRWSSHGALARDAPPRWLAHDRLEDHVGALGGDPRHRYTEFVHAHRRRPPNSESGH